MESWEEMVSKLPSDETLERLEKEGKLDEFDRQLDELEKKIKEVKEKFRIQNEEIDKMLNENNPQEDKKRNILN